MHTHRPPQDILDSYLKQKSEFVELDRENLSSEIDIIEGNFLVDYEEEHSHNELERASNANQNVGLHYIRHDSHKIAETIQRLLSKYAHPFSGKETQD